MDSLYASRISPSGKCLELTQTGPQRKSRQIFPEGTFWTTPQAHVEWNNDEQLEVASIKLWQWWKVSKITGRIFDRAMLTAQLFCKTGFEIKRMVVMLILPPPLSGVHVQCASCLIKSWYCYNVHTDFPFFAFARMFCKLNCILYTWLSSTKL